MAVTVASLLSAETPVGHTIRGRTRKIARERIWAFSGGPLSAQGWPRTNHHTDDAYARTRGLPSARVSGTQYLGYVCGLLADLFGDSWLSAGTISAKYVAPVNPDDAIQPVVTVTSKEIVGDVIRFGLAIRCENELGQEVLVGTAIGHLS